MQTHKAGSRPDQSGTLLIIPNSEACGVNYLLKMAPRLALSQVELVRDMILSREPLTTSQIAGAANCSECSVSNIRLKLDCLVQPEHPLTMLDAEGVSLCRC